MSAVGVAAANNLLPPAGSLGAGDDPKLKAKSAVLKKVVLVSPAMAGANNGNWHTAHRWHQFLANHSDIALLADWPQPSALPATGAALMIALHARRSAPSIAAWARALPQQPLVVMLTGTDLYRDIQSDPTARLSLDLASHLVVLQDAGLDTLAALSAAWRAKAQVIYQSATALKPAPPRPADGAFRVVMVGHLRAEKDPLTFMAAARLAAAPALVFEQIGDALEPALGEAAAATARACAAYFWRGGLARAPTRQRIKQAQLLVNCSQMEGGAHVILEAVRSGTPVLASRISGNVGMLGADYAGYFEFGNSGQLAALVARCLQEPAFLAQLQRQCCLREPRFATALEKQLVLNLVRTAHRPPIDTERL